MGTNGLQPAELRAVLHALMQSGAQSAPAVRFVALLKERLPSLPDYVPPSGSEAFALPPPPPQPLNDPAAAALPPPPPPPPAVDARPPVASPGIPPPPPPAAAAAVPTTMPPTPVATAVATPTPTPPPIAPPTPTAPPPPTAPPTAPPPPPPPPPPLSALKPPTAAEGNVRDELVAALRANPRASLRRVSSTAADEISALRESVAQSSTPTELVSEGGGR
jgi:hypothetical protein